MLDRQTPFFVSARLINVGRGPRAVGLSARLGPDDQQRM